MKSLRANSRRLYILILTYLTYILILTVTHHVTLWSVANVILQATRVLYIVPGMPVITPQSAEHRNKRSEFAQSRSFWWTVKLKISRTYLFSGGISRYPPSSFSPRTVLRRTIQFSENTPESGPRHNSRVSIFIIISLNSVRIPSNKAGPCTQKINDIFWIQRGNESDVRVCKKRVKELFICEKIYL